MANVAGNRFVSLPRLHEIGGVFCFSSARQVVSLQQTPSFHVKSKTMKLHPLLWGLLLVALPFSTTHARLRSHLEAADVAATRLHKDVHLLPYPDSGSSSLTRAAVATAPAYYIFGATDNQGFVVVAADDDVPSVLAYSTTGTFDWQTVPPALLDLLTDYEQQLSDNQGTTTVTSHPANHTVDTGRIASRILDTALWGQSRPFNNLCPRNYPAGCVATAMCIVMQYHRHPQQGQGSHSYRFTLPGDNQITTLAADFEHTTYQWDLMPQSYETYTEEQGEAVATLALHAGISVSMEYEPSGSAGALYQAKNALIHNFKYKPGILHSSPSNFTTEEWTALLQAEIDAGRPILYGGNGARDGHAFVIDGYEGDLFHVNWGWQGSYNGLYRLGALRPGGSNYSNQQEALLGIEPDESGRLYATFQLDALNNGTGLSMTTADVRKEQPFTLMVSGLSNFNDSSFDGELCAVLCDAEGHLKSVLGRTPLKLVMFDQKERIELSCTATEDALPGDRVRLTALPKGTDSHRFVTVAADDDLPDYLPATGYELPFVPVSWTVPTGVQIAHTSPMPNTSTQWLRGSKASFRLTPPADCKLMLVYLNGENITRQLDTNGTFTVDIVNRAAYRIEVRTYTEHDILPSATVRTTAAGQLANCLPDTDCNRVQALHINGPLNAEDLTYLTANSGFLTELYLDGCYLQASDSTPDGTLPHGALRNAGLTSLTLPANLSVMKGSSLAGNSIKSILLPATVTTLENYVFEECPALSDYIVLSSIPPTAGKYTFLYSTRETAILHVPAGSGAAYRAHAEWSKFGTIAEDAPTKQHILPDTSKIRWSLSADGRLRFSCEHSKDVALYSPSGQLLTYWKSTIGNTVLLPSRGVYILVTDSCRQQIAY